uniref:Uncharacterized protein n=1 Tax=Caenorhabditis tropicalis TaxID=1561998 RepID=A0A1I7UHQ4_9PELO
MRWIGLGASKVRSLCTGPPEKDFSRIVTLYKFWEKYLFRQDLLAQDQPAIDISRSDRRHDYYLRIGVRKGCPRVVLFPPDGKIAEAKEYLKGMARNGLVRGIRLQDEKKEFLEECESLFSEVLRAIREEDFSKLSEFTLGGHQTLQFHRSAAHKLSKIQKESLNITQNDLFGDNGYIIKFPYFRNEMSSYIHSIDFTNIDALGNSHPASGENQENKVFFKYKVVMGGIYKYDVLLKEIRKGSEMWNAKIRTPKDYVFKWPRYVIVELDICQEAISQYPIKLEKNRFLYDFHVYSF